MDAGDLEADGPRRVETSARHCTRNEGSGDQDAATREAKEVVILVSLVHGHLPTDHQEETAPRLADEAIT